MATAVVLIVAIASPAVAGGVTHMITSAGTPLPGVGQTTAVATSTVLLSSGTVHVSGSGTAILADNIDVSTFGAVRVLAEATAHLDYEVLADSLHIAQHNGIVRLSDVYDVPGLSLTLKVTEADGLPGGQDVSWAIYGLPNPVVGGSEGSVVLGGVNIASTATAISNTANSDDVLVGQSQGGGSSVRGISTVGKGVHGQATTGTGVYATATTGAALQVVGKAKFDRAGTLTIRKGQTSYKKTLTGVTSSSQVFAVLRTYRSGTYVAAVVCGTGYFTIRLNKAMSADTKVSYFVVN